MISLTGLPFAATPVNSIQREMLEFPTVLAGHDVQGSYVDIWNYLAESFRPDAGGKEVGRGMVIRERLWRRSRGWLLVVRKLCRVCAL